MREIKFRAWYDDCDEKRYLQSCDIGITCDGKLLSRYGYSNEFTLINESNIILEQFTGLHDKNGKDIYDGDIIKEFGMKDTWTLSRRDEFSERVHIIGWHEHDMQWVGALLDEYKLGLIDTRDLGFLNDKYMLEIIGNIHENKELLEDVK